jgi:hypothetical protein
VNLDILNGKQKKVKNDKLIGKRNYQKMNSKEEVSSKQGPKFINPNDISLSMHSDTESALSLNLKPHSKTAQSISKVKLNLVQMSQNITATSPFENVRH